MSVAADSPILWMFRSIGEDPAEGDRRRHERLEDRFEFLGRPDVAVDLGDQSFAIELDSRGDVVQFGECFGCVRTNFLSSYGELVTVFFAESRFWLVASAEMNFDTDNAVRVPLVCVVGFVLVLSGCSHSNSAQTSTETSPSKSSSDAPADESSSRRRESTEASSEDAFSDPAELKKLQGETARLEARTEIVEIQSKVQSHYLMDDDKELPDSLSDLTEGENPVIDSSRILRDPWGNRYIYRKGEEGYIEIFSPGPDGEPGTDDDVRP